MLTHADTREKLTDLRCVIIDEWHELLGTKRGVQTELCLARLRSWLPELRTWALSATIGNLKEAATTIAPNERPPPEGLHPAAQQPEPKPEPPRKPKTPPPTIISANIKKPLSIETLIPEEIDHFPWSGHIGTSLAPRVVSKIESARSTLLFTNTRSQTEIWFQELLQLRPSWTTEIAMHHGSLDRSERDRAENGLRDGSLKCVVATSSLDLGVDFSPVDQVIQIGSPKGIARLLQRAGRSGHQPGASSKILGVPTNALELVEFAAARQAASTRTIESRQPLSKPLDILTQHLVTCAIGEPFFPANMLAEIRSTHAYRHLTDTEWEWALTFISKGGKALSAYPRYQKATLDSQGRFTVTGKRLVTQHRLSMGTISSSSNISLKFANGQTLGTVEEGFISKLKPGSTLVFAGRHLSLVRIRDKTATVKPSRKSAKGQVAIWGGSKMPLSSELSHAFSTLINKEGLHPAAQQPKQTQSSKHNPSTPNPSPRNFTHPSPELQAVSPILAIQQTWSHLPSDSSLLIEHTRTREGEHLFLYPFAGRLVHEGLAALLAFRISRENPETITALQNDYGFILTARRNLPLLGKHPARTPHI